MWRGDTWALPGAPETLTSTGLGLVGSGGHFRAEHVGAQGTVGPAGHARGTGCSSRPGGCAHGLLWAASARASAWADELAGPGAEPAGRQRPGTAGWSPPPLPPPLLGAQQ